MSSKSDKIAELLQGCADGRHDPHYVGFFVCFNRAQFFEAHEVLEELWLEDRYGPDGDFYKGLIQYAGAFVHLQKDRPGPSAALLRLAQANLGKYPAHHHDLDVADLLLELSRWLRWLEEGRYQENPYPQRRPAPLTLSPSTHS